MNDKLTIAIILFTITFIYLMKKREEDFQKKRFRVAGKNNKLIFSIKHFAMLALITALIAGALMLILMYTILD